MLALMVIKAKMVNEASDLLNILFNELVVVGADAGISITAVAATIPPHHCSFKRRCDREALP